MTYLHTFRLTDVRVCVWGNELTDPDNINILTTLSGAYDFQMANSLSDERWNFAVYDTPIVKISAPIIMALAREAHIVSFSFFKQLCTCPSEFNWALQQIPCIAFNAQMLLPRAARKTLFSEIFSGIRRIICLSEAFVPIMQVMLDFQESGARPAVELFDRSSGIRFCDLVMAQSSSSELTRFGFTEAVRYMLAKDIEEAFVTCDCRNLMIQIHRPILDAKAELVEKMNSDVRPAKKLDVREPADSRASHPQGACYSGPSLTCVVSSDSVFRQNRVIEGAPDAVVNFKRFKKCHPVNHYPGMIPALIGPEQLVSTTEVSTLRAAAQTKKDDDEWSTGPRSKFPVHAKRMLVRDEWLAEDKPSSSRLSPGNENTMPERPAAVPASAPAPAPRQYQSALFKSLQR